MNMIKSEIIEKVDYLITEKLLLVLRDMVKYGLVSAFALAVDAGLLYVLVEYYGVHYLLAATIAFCFGLAVNYALGKIFVFKHSKMPPSQEFVLYASVGAIGLGLNDLIIYVLVWLNLWYLYAKAVSVAVVFFFNFFGRRRLFAE